jgi:histidinol-phosphatase (PHP family)
MANLRLKVDSHLHSTYSCDAKSTVDEMCLFAIELGLEVICFTEHMDLNPVDDGLNYFRYEEYARTIHQSQEKYSGKLEILMGVEFSEPHEYPGEFEQLMKKDFDFVLAGFHYLGDKFMGNKALLENLTVEQVYENYYREVLKTVQFGGFDCLAHIDFPKRYLGGNSEPDGLLEEILQQMIKSKIALEINSSSIRRGYPELHPSDAILDLYIKSGGRRVTTGSDSHKREQISSHFDLISEKITQYKLQPVFFRKRQAVEIQRSKK